MASSHSPRGAVDPEAPHGDLRVLQVDAVGQQRLHILVVLGLQLRHGREVVEVLLDEVGHELLVEGQLVVAGDHDLVLVGQAACRADTDTHTHTHTHRGHCCWLPEATGQLGEGGQARAPGSPVRGDPPSRQVPSDHQP